MDNLMTPEQRAERHRAWLKTFGFTDRDWQRIRVHAMLTDASNQPAALDDLDAPYRVGAVMAEKRRHSSGALLGVYRGRAILAWPQTSDGHDGGPASRW